MAKKSLVVKEHLKQRLVKKYESKRDALRKILNSPSESPMNKLKAQFSMQKLPRNSSASRLNTRCHVSGRPKAVLKKFGLARSEFREQALLGYIPGVKKASW